MREVEFVPFRLTDNADIYSIRIGGGESTEFQEFLLSFKDSEDKYLEDDLNRILLSLNTIIKGSAKETYFRPEGNMTDRVVALPLYTTPRNKKKHGTLRLYCIRISDNLLILGGGGEKATQTYEEDAFLLEKVRTLQNIDKELSRLEDYGVDIHTRINNLTINIQ